MNAPSPTLFALDPPPTNFVIGAQAGTNGVNALAILGTNLLSAPVWRVNGGASPLGEPRLVADLLCTNGALRTPARFALEWKNTTGLEPAADTDEDGVSDWDEIFRHGTDPRQSDTDGDGLSDGAEILASANPRDADENGDGIPDGVFGGSHPASASGTVWITSPDLFLGWAAATRSIHRCLAGRLAWCYACDMYHDPDDADACPHILGQTAAPANRVSFPSGTNGTEVVVHGDVAGNVTLTVHIAGYAGPPPICEAKVVPETTIPIHAFIICETGYASTNAAGIHSIVDGVNDIYSQVGRVNSVTGLVSRARIPADWGSQSDEGYYTSDLQQSHLVRRLLMFGVGNPDKRDISSGDIQGNWRQPFTSGAYQDTLSPVGFFIHANSNPVSN